MNVFECILFECFCVIPVWSRTSMTICDVLRDLVSFVQFGKREKHSWRNATFSKVTG